MIQGYADSLPGEKEEAHDGCIVQASQNNPVMMFMTTP